MDFVPRFFQSLAEGLVGLSAGLVALRAVMPPLHCNPNPVRDVQDCVRLNVTAENPAIVGIPGSFWPYHSFVDTGPKFIAGRLDRAFRKTCLLECPWFTNATYPNVPTVTVTPSATPSKVHHWYALEKDPDITYANLPGDWELVDHKVPGKFDKILQGIASFVLSTKGPDSNSEPVSMVTLCLLIFLFIGLAFYAAWRSITDWHRSVIKARVAKEASRRDADYKRTIEDLNQRIAQLEAADRKKAAELQRKATIDAVNKRIAQLEAQQSGTSAELKRLGNRKHDKSVNDTLNRMADLERTVDGTEEDINHLNAREKSLSELQQKTSNRVADLVHSIDGTEDDINRLKARDKALSEFQQKTSDRMAELSRSLNGTKKDMVNLPDYQRHQREREKAVNGLMLRLANVEKTFERFNTRDGEVSTALAGYQRDFSSHQQLFAKLQAEVRERFTALEEGSRRRDARDAEFSVLLSDHKRDYECEMGKRAKGIEDLAQGTVDLAKHLTELQDCHDNLSVKLLGKIEQHIAAHNDLDVRHIELDTRHKAMDSTLKYLNSRYTALDNRTKEAMVDSAKQVSALDNQVKDLDARQKTAQDDLDTRHKTLDSFVKTLDSRAQALAARQSGTETRSKEMRERVINACNSLGSWNHKAGEEFNVVLQNFDGFEGSMVAALSATFHALHHIHARVLPPGMPRPGFPGSPGFSPGRPMPPQFPPGPVPQPQWPQGHWVQSQWAPVQAPHGLQGPVVQNSAPQSPAPQGNVASPRQQGTPGNGPQAQTPSK